MAVYAYGYGLDVYDKPVTPEEIYPGFQAHASEALRKNYAEFLSSEALEDSLAAFAQFADSEDYGRQDMWDPCTELLLSAMVTDELKREGYKESCLYQDDCIYIPVCLPQNNDGSDTVPEKTANRIFGMFSSGGDTPREMEYLFVDDGS